MRHRLAKLRHLRLSATLLLIKPSTCCTLQWRFGTSKLSGSWRVVVIVSRKWTLWRVDNFIYALLRRVRYTFCLSFDAWNRLRFGLGSRRYNWADDRRIKAILCETSREKRESRIFGKEITHSLF